jgi:hypothetical protein
LFEIGRRSSGFQPLFPDALSHQKTEIAQAWAMLQIPDLPMFGDSVFELVQHRKLGPLKHRHDLLMQSKAYSVVIATAGMWIDGKQFTQPPFVNVQTAQVFVQTGWTHQRTDGGPDRRFTNNPPTGYHKTVGYDVIINNTTTRWQTNPTRFVNQIRELGELLERRIKPLANQALSQARTARSVSLFAPKAMTCPKCGYQAQNS